jgi:alkylated DNA repair dioxygenase AlkB
MFSLFPIEVDSEDIPRIPGLSYLRGYISPREEAELIAAIDREPWDTSWERRRQLYGGAYGIQQSSVRSIPEWGSDLGNRIWRDGFNDRPFDHMLINEYLPGQGIAMHRDYEPYDRTVVSLSLLAPSVMDFRRVGDSKVESLLLEPRSLLVLTDAARYEWQHGIARRKNDRWKGLKIPRARRVSVTFRARKVAT